MKEQKFYRVETQLKGKETFQNMYFKKEADAVRYLRGSLVEMYVTERSIESLQIACEESLRACSYFGTYITNKESIYSHVAIYQEIMR